MKVRVGVVGANGVPPSYGGWDQLVEQFTKYESDNYEFVIYCSYLTNSQNFSKYNNATVRVVNLNANGWQSIPYDIISLYLAKKECDYVIMLGTSGAVALPVSWLFNQKVVVNVDGTEWLRGKWPFLIRQFLLFSEWCAVRFASQVVADNKEIGKYIADKYKLEPAIVTYGGDHVVKRTSKRHLKKYGVVSGAYAFKVCRIVPENNIELILESFYQTKFPFILVGNFESSSFGKGIKLKYKEASNIQCVNPIYDQVILDALRSNCSFYVHGHSVGGTNPSLVEAMSLGLNIFAFDVAYNRTTTGDNAHFFQTVNDLNNLIGMQTKGKLRPQNKAAKRFANRHYKWDFIISEYIKIIDKLGCR